ncbi:MAG: hypothetical protein COV46_01000 [Deltaproteobacteria bacterium CG11_big_fil_rev_8_21_14_0_20_49_13]|nr:MAG: hypothetical protein COV46_01000 [Deltaproteobacteria bacterium CG11_big_fil_rev_8_21_14_0_20_49_13]
MISCLCSSNGAIVKKLFFFLFLIFSVTLLSCGSSGTPFNSTVSTQAPPYVNRIDPAIVNPGDTLTIFGLGYSIVPGYNIVTFGDVSTVSENYFILTTPTSDEIESITVVVPANVPAGTQTVYVSVIGNTSNTNMSVNVN